MWWAPNSYCSYSGCSCSCPTPPEFDAASAGTAANLLAARSALAEAVTAVVMVAADGGTDAAAGIAGNTAVAGRIAAAAAVAAAADVSLRPVPA